MKDLTQQYVEQLEKMVVDLREEKFKLVEENKNLRAYADNLDSENDNQAIEIEELKKENKKLKEDVDYRHHRAMVAERGWEDED